jgi:hypothetical protein
MNIDVGMKAQCRDSIEIAGCVRHYAVTGNRRGDRFSVCLQIYYEKWWLGYRFFIIVV